MVEKIMTELDEMDGGVIVDAIRWFAKDVMGGASYEAAHRIFAHAARDHYDGSARRLVDDFKLGGHHVPPEIYMTHGRHTLAAIGGAREQH